MRVTDPFPFQAFLPLYSPLYLFIPFLFCFVFEIGCLYVALAVPELIM